MNWLPSLILPCLLAQSIGPVPTMEVRPKAANIAVGEKFEVEVQLRGPAGTTYEFPKEISDGAVELIHSRNNSTAERGSYEAQVFAIGEAARIPEIVIQYRSPDGSSGSVKSAPVPLNVVSTLDPSEQNPAPADFAPPVAVEVSRIFWVVNGALGALLLFGLFLLIRQLRFPKKPQDPTVTPAMSPEEHALNQLARLSPADAVRDPRGFYILLVQILKQFLEHRLEAPVLEMTSTETLALVKGHAWTAPHAVAIRELVNSADLAKFGGVSDASNAERQIQLVRDLVARIDRLRRADLELRSRETDRRKTA